MILVFIMLKLLHCYIIFLLYFKGQIALFQLGGRSHRCIFLWNVIILYFFADSMQFKWFSLLFLFFYYLFFNSYCVGMATGRVRVSWSHPHNKNSSPSSNPTGIQLLTHPHRVTGIFLYSYPYPFFYCSIYQLNIFYKKNLKITPTESWYYQNIQY